MANSMLCVSHDSALHYWRTNPPWYVLEGASQNIRSLRDTPKGTTQFESFDISEEEFGPDPIDVLVPYDAPRCGNRFRRHGQRAKLPPHALYPIRDGVFVVSPELCLMQFCNSHDFFEALEVGMEFCGFYALNPQDDERGRRRDYGLLSVTACRKHYASWKDLGGIVQARKVARYLADGSGSPMETKMFLLMCLPQKYGGYNLPLPELNPKLPLTDEGALLLRSQNVYPDFLWRNAGLAVEYDGAYHDDPGQSAKDAMRKTVIESMGYTVLQVKRWQLYNPLAFDAVVKTIARIIGKRLRPLSLSQSYARDELRQRLLSSESAREGGE